MLNRKKQSGITFIGFLMVCALIMFFAYLGMRLWPVYNEKIKIDKAMESIAARDDVARLNKSSIVKYMLNSFEIEDVDQFSKPKHLKDIFTVKKIKGKQKRLMQMAYEIRRPIVGEQLDVIYKYNKSIVIDGTGE